MFPSESAQPTSAFASSRPITQSNWPLIVASINGVRPLEVLALTSMCKPFESIVNSASCDPEFAAKCKAVKSCIP